MFPLFCWLTLLGVLLAAVSLNAHEASTPHAPITISLHAPYPATSDKPLPRLQITSPHDPSAPRFMYPAQFPRPKFNLTRLSPGPYIVQIDCPRFHYPLLRLDISSKSGKIRLMRNDHLAKVYPSSSGSSYSISPLADVQHFVAKQSFNITAWLKNPMILVMLFGVVMLLFMPYLADSESMKEVQTMIGEGEDALGGWLNAAREQAKKND